VVLLISDGIANEAVNETIPEAGRLKNDGRAVIKALAIGERSSVNFDLLESVVSQPSQHNVLHTPNLNELADVAALLVSATCNGLLLLVLTPLNVGWSKFTVAIFAHLTGVLLQACLYLSICLCVCLSQHDVPSSQNCLCVICGRGSVLCLHK